MKKLNYKPKYVCKIAKPKKFDTMKLDHITKEELFYNYEQIAEDYDGLPEIESLFEIFR